MPTEQSLLLSRSTLTQAWQARQWKELAAFLHPEVVFLAPTASPLCTGLEACVASYQEFSSQAIIHEYIEATPHVQIVDTTALTSTPFNITYEYEASKISEQGIEVLAWVMHEERWLVIWRMLLSAPVANQE